jgi:outer membrane lipoprotein-sorting protein
MKRLLAWVLACGAAAGAVAAPPVPAPAPTAAEIVTKNAVERGGTEAWQTLQTMVWAGHAESANTPGRKMPFLLELKRPGRTRFEIATGAGKSVRIYDGTNGWKLRPNSAGAPELQPYTADELAFARGAQVIDGPLMDYAAKGGAITLAGVDTVEGRKCYVLNARLPSGEIGRVWVDAETFLEARADREVRTAAGLTATATAFYNNYRLLEGRKVPLTIETRAASGGTANKLIIEKIAFNPPIDDKTFDKPPLVTPRHGGVIVDARDVSTAPAPPRPPAPRP